MKRKVLVGIAFALAGLLLSLGQPTKEAFTEPLRVGVSRDIKNALIYVADSEGLFKRHSVDVVSREYETGILAVNDLVAGTIDIATASDFAFVLQSFKQPDLRMPATICMASDQELVVRKDRNIARPQDLKGRRVAVIRAGQTEFFLYSYLVFNGIPTGSVQVVYHTPSEMVKAMVGGTIDAALCWAPYSTEIMKQLGSKIARWPAQSGQDYYFALFAKEEFLKREPKTVERFLAALLEAEGFMAKHPDRAKSILRQRLKTDAEWARYSFSSFG